MERINLMWVRTDAVKRDDEHRNKIIISGRRRRRYGEPGGEVEIVIHGVYDLHCLLLAYAEAENKRLENATDRHTSQRDRFTKAAGVFDNVGKNYVYLNVGG